MREFDYDLDYKSLDLRAQPALVAMPIIKVAKNIKARYPMIKKVKAALMVAKSCHDKRKTQLKQNPHESLKLNGMNAVRTKIT